MKRWTNKKTLHLQGPSYTGVTVGKKAKGEEKPEEELMGKRKSSPRLATTPEVMLLPLFLSLLGKVIQGE